MRIIKPSRKARGTPSSELEAQELEIIDVDISSAGELASQGLESDRSSTKKNSNNYIGERIGERRTKNVDASSDSSNEKKEFHRLMASGVRMLAMREHSVQEVTQKLSSKSESYNQVAAVVEELLDKKYLSDERFAESYVRARSNRGFGPVKIRSELKNKGVSNQLIEEYLDMNSPIWLDRACDQYHKKYGGDPVSDYNEWSKRARFMQSRGFTMEHIRVSLPEIEFN